MDSIQVEGGVTQQEYYINRFGENPTVRKIRLGIKWSIGLILFLSVVIFAGFRGVIAYNNQSVTLIQFEQRSSVNFPAVTICPMEPSNLSLVECVKETGSNDVVDCSSSKYSRIFPLEGSFFQCLTFNDPQDGSQPIFSESLADEFEIQIMINSSQVPIGEAIGVLVMLHDQGSEPLLEEESSFVSTIGELTEVWISLNNIHYINGSTENDFKASTSAADLREDTPGSFQNLIAVAMSFTQQGVFINQEYYVYTPNNWIGEIGGFVCLLWFLHWVVTNILLFIILKVKGLKMQTELF